MNVEEEDNHPNGGPNISDVRTEGPVSEGHHHDIHGLPPHFIQEAYSHYNKIKTDALDNDLNVIDFARGLTEKQKNALEHVGSVSAACIQQASRAYRDVVLGQSTSNDYNVEVSEDAHVYEHKDFPGLQMIPDILPPEAQVLFVSQIMHNYLSDPGHKINLDQDYDIDYPKASKEGYGDGRSFFTYSPSGTFSKPKDSSKHQSLNGAQFLSKKLRWLTLGDSQYDWKTRSYDKSCPTSFPDPIKQLVATLFPHMRSESGVCLLYGGKDYMPVHRDVSEQCQTGLASFSFGCDGIFLVARGEHEAIDEEDKKQRIVAIRVRSGDCVHMDGETRWAWHAMPRTITGTCPRWLKDWPVGTPGATKGDEARYKAWKGYFGSKRLNVSCRQIWE